MSIDYQEIIEELDDEKVKELLDRLDVPYRDQGAAIIMPTVCHNEDADEASWKLYYYKNTHVFQCYTECGAMSIFTFLKNFMKQEVLNMIGGQIFLMLYSIAHTCGS